MTDIERHKRICGSLNELYAEKNKKYGNSFAESMEEFGMLVPALRLTEKLKRFKHLVKHPEEDDGGESMEDTLRDIANYAVIALVEMEKK